jgi:hypothetical protein
MFQIFAAFITCAPAVVIKKICVCLSLQAGDNSAPPNLPQGEEYDENIFSSHLFIAPPLEGLGRL